MAVIGPLKVPPGPPTAEAVQERLEHWHEVLMQVKSGVDPKTTLGTCWLALDRWLDEKADQMGPTPLADVWDREWPATWINERMSQGIEDR